MSEECSEKKHEAINRHAASSLQVLLKDLESKHGDEQYETEFLGDLYARMIFSFFMGYFPQKMAKDAEDGAKRLMELWGMDTEGVEDD